MQPESMDWRIQTSNDVIRIARDLSFWRDYFRNHKHGDDLRFSLHLGVFNQPYLDFVLCGRKTVESRFSAVRCAPYDRVTKGDVLIVKAASGPVVGLCLIEHVWSYRLDAASWKFVRRSFTQQLCAEDPEFWSSRTHANFATLMRITRPTAVDGIACEKRDRRGWVVISPGVTQAKLSV